MNYLQMFIAKINDDFPTLPTIYSSLLEVMSNPRSTVTDVANIISQDQSSSVKILKSVNSSIYGLKVKVETISEAIFHIGFNEVKNLVASLSIIKIFATTVNTPKFTLVDLWKHSIAVGVITRLLGKLIGSKNIENYFLSGIVHDIGKLFFLKEFSVEYSKVVLLALEKEIPIRLAEREVFGTTHMVIGDLIAEKWRLPVSIRNTIKHHSLGIAGSNIDTQIAIVHLANIIGRVMGLGYAGDNLIPEPNLGTWDILNLPPRTLSGLMPTINSDFEQSVSILLVN